MPPKNKTSKSEIYWAIRYNMCPSSKENKKSSGGGGGAGYMEWVENVREVAYTGKGSKTKNQGWWWYLKVKGFTKENQNSRGWGVGGVGGGNEAKMYWGVYGNEAKMEEGTHVY